VFFVFDRGKGRQEKVRLSNSIHNVLGGRDICGEIAVRIRVMDAFSSCDRKPDRTLLLAEHAA
jgi:hypothetical protein